MNDERRQAMMLGMVPTADDLKAYTINTRNRMQAVWPNAWVTLTCWDDRWTFTVHGLPDGNVLRAQGKTLPDMLADFEHNFKEATSKIMSEADLRRTLGIDAIEVPRPDDVIVVPQDETGLRRTPSRAELRMVHPTE